MLIKCTCMGYPSDIVGEVEKKYADILETIFENYDVEITHWEMVNDHLRIYCRGDEQGCRMLGELEWL